MATVVLLRRPSIRPLFSRQIPLRATAMSTPFSTLRSFLVTPAEVEAAIKKNAPSRLSTDPRTIPICGSWFLPNDPQQRKGLDVFEQAHIRTARFFDIDAIADTTSPYPHMLPSPQVFKDVMSKFGIRRDDTLVVYDTAELGIFSAPRVAWTLRVFGHPSVHILNNFKLWVEQGYPTEQGEQKHFDETDYPVPELDGSKVVAFEEMKQIAQDYNKEGAESIQVLDARSEGRWQGLDPEPRPGLPSGHIPGSISVPVPMLLDPKTNAFLPAEELRKVFAQRGVEAGKPVISSCGTGVTATVIDAALIEAGYGEGSRRIYDGSWTEWAQRVQPGEHLIRRAKE